MGAQYIRAYMHAQNTRGVNGNLNFTGQYSTVGGTSGLGYADFVTGQLSAFGQGRPFYDNDKSDYYGLYVQDAWRVGAHLTVNLGLRFEPYLPQRNTDGYVEAFSMTNFLAGKIGTPPVSNPVLTPPAGLIFPGDAGYPPNNQYNYRANHWLPRVGIVWDPFGDGKTSIRASYGLLYDTPHLFFYTRVSNNPPWGATLTRTGGPFPLSNPWAGYPGGDPYVQNTGTAKSYGFFPTSGVYAVSDTNLGSPQINTWNLSIQRQVGKWLLSGSYLGNHTAHLWSSRELNPQIYIPGNCVAGQYGLTAAGTLLQHQRQQHRRAPQAHPREPNLGTVVQHHRLPRRRRHLQLQRHDPVRAAPHGEQLQRARQLDLFPLPGRPLHHGTHRPIVCGPEQPLRRPLQLQFRSSPAGQHLRRAHFAQRA